MTKRKLLLAVITILLVLALTGCEHKHDYRWAFGDNLDLAFQYCADCLYIRDLDKTYSDPVEAKSQSTGGDVNITSPIYFVAEAESGIHNYGEEFNISLEVTMPHGFNAGGPVYVRLAESPYFEIVGDAMQEAIDTGELTHYNKYQLTFRVKPTSPTHLPEGFNFQIKFNPTDECKQDLSYHPEDGDWWYYNPSEEYFYGYKKLTFMNDSLGMLICDNTLPYGTTLLFYDSINRELLNGYIDKDTYIDRAYDYSLEDSANIINQGRDYKTGVGTFEYLSPNIRAEFELTKSYKEFDSLWANQENRQESRAELAKILVGILYENEHITKEQYDNEIKTIEEKPIGANDYVSYYYCPIRSYYEENRIDYYYAEEQSNANNPASSYVGNNFATVNLINDRVDAGETFDVVVYGDFCNLIKGCSVDIQNGLSLFGGINIDDNKISFSLIHDIRNANPRFSMNIIFDNEEETTISVNVFGYASEGILYLSQWSQEDAYKVYWDYSNIDQLIQISEEFEEIQDEVDGGSDIASNYSREVSDSSISGVIYWKDDDKNTFPFQYGLVSFYERDALSEELLYSCLTNSEGEFTFEFNNDTSGEENGLDIFMRVWASGSDVSVTYGRVGVVGVDIYYYKDYDLFTNFSTGHRSVEIKPIEMEAEGEMLLFGHAVQISQAAIMASKYYEAMKCDDVNDLPITYPHNILQNDSCFYLSSDLPNGRVYIVSPFGQNGSIFSYASWDVIMHEYGHFVADMENVATMDGGWHGIEESMADHYALHFNNPVACGCSGCAFENAGTIISTYTLDDCKEIGTNIAWSEGFATYFSMVSQEYAQEYFGLGNVVTVGDGKYDAYNFTNGPSEVNNYNKGTESTEATIQSILYDLYDSDTGEAFDTISVGHETMWSLIMGSGATTFDEFDDYFLARCESINREDMQKYGRILSAFGLAPENIISNGAKTVQQPTFYFDWVEDNSTKYFNNRTFRLNFYDKRCYYIGSTAEQSLTAPLGTYCVTVDDTLWQAVLNRDGGFYVSVTIFENHTPKTEYESEWSYFDSPVEIMVVDLTYSQTLAVGDCYWYKFTATSDSDYNMYTLGTADTVIELFEFPVCGNSTEGMIYQYTDGGSNGNVDFNIYLTAGQTVYLRVKGEGWSATGIYCLYVDLVDHTHSYTHHYVKKSITIHNSYCACGEHIEESHNWVTQGNGSVCRVCGYYTSIKIPSGPSIMSNKEVPWLSDEEKQ